MKRRHVVFISAVSVAALLTGTCGVRSLVSDHKQYAYASEMTETKGTVVKEPQIAASTTTTKKIMDDLNSIQKEETVYVLGNADGSVNQMIVSNWLKNFGDSTTLTDKSDLTDIVNVKGEETFTSDADGKLSWNANGNDIYYQGTSTKEAPVSISIKYSLDGAEISPEELKGKSGNLKITISYTNHKKTTAMIDGKSEEVYVPFLCASGMLLDDTTFKNVTVENGQLINDGAKSIVIGAAFPGLSDSLGLTKEQLDLPEEITVSADVTNYEPLVIMTAVTNDVFNHVDLKGDSSELTNLDDSLTKLSDASSQLTEGCQDLYDGLKTLSDKSGILIDGVKKLSSGATTLKTSMPALTEGANTLKTGIDHAKSGADSLKRGADQMKTGVDSLDDAAGKLKGGIDSVDAGLSKLMAQNDALNAGATKILDNMFATANAQIKAAGLTIPELTVKNYKTVLDQTVAKLSEAAVKQPEMKQAVVTIKTLEAQLDSVATFCQGVNAYTNGVSQAQAGTKKLSSGASKMVEGTKTLSKGANQLSEGAGTLSAGAAKLSVGAQSLADGSKKAGDGAKVLADGLTTLLTNSKALVDGVAQLTEGAKTLKDGMKEFNDTGISKLVNAFDGDMNQLLDRIDVLCKISKEYKSFSGIEDDMKGSVKFIYKNE